MNAVSALLAVFLGGFSWPGAAAVDAADLDSLDRGQRLRAVERLGERPTGDVRPLLVPLLADSDAAVRAAAARVLLRAGAPEATAAALRWVTAPTAVDRPMGLAILREAATLPPEGRAAVNRCLRDADVAVRLAAIDVLSRHGPAASFSALAMALDDEQREVRLRAIRLLEEAHDRRAVTLLLGKLADSDRQVNLDAIHALGAMGDPGAAPALYRTVQNGPDDLRLAGVDALAALGLPAAVSFLAPLANRHPTDELEHHALLALGQIATPPAIALLIERLRQPPISDDVKEALRRAGAAAVTPLLTEVNAAGRGASVATVTAAATILGGINDRRATPALASLVDRHHPAAVEALKALATLKDPSALVMLVRAAADPDPDVRRLSFEALIAIGDAGGAVALESGLSDSVSDVRRAALRLAARIFARGAATGVLANVADDDGGVRREALVTLAALAVAPPGTMAALLSVGQRLERASDVASTVAEGLALGDALERVATEADRQLLASAIVKSTGAAQGPLLRGLIAAVTSGVPPAPNLVPTGHLLAVLGRGGALAETAADALAALSPLAGDDGGSSDEAGAREADLIAAFDGAEPPVRARLTMALARRHTAAARARLRAALTDGHETDDVRAAAAWAAAGLLNDGALDVSLKRLAADAAAGPIAANARAALAAAGRGRGGSERAWAQRWTAVRLLAPAGLGPLPRQWLLLRADGGEPVWAMTGTSGEVRVWGLRPGPVTVSPAQARLSLAVRP
jgi:HEAT repeat protein